MSKIITKIYRKKGLDYRIDKDGNIIESKYNWFKDKSTIIMLIILLLGGLYYFQMSKSATNVENFDEYCVLYSKLRNDFVLDNPGVEINVYKVLEYYDDNRGRLNKKLNITNG